MRPDSTVDISIGHLGKNKIDGKKKQGFVGCWMDVAANKRSRSFVTSIFW
jgi:hypothetical protein